MLELLLNNCDMISHCVHKLGLQVCTKLIMVITCRILPTKSDGQLERCVIKGLDCILEKNSINFTFTLRMKQS